MHIQTLLTYLAIPIITSAHFHIVFPTPRTTIDDTEPQFPCGGFAVTSNRTTVPSQGFPVALELEHDQTTIQMLLAVGNTPGSNFNVVLEKTFIHLGEGSFCLPSVLIPSDLNIADGSNATLQVVTDGEGGGGLYMCADITFSSTASSSPPSSCINGTGSAVSALPANEANINANQTNGDGSLQSGQASASGSASGSATASGSSSSSTNQAVASTVGWSILGGAALGAIALM